VPRAHRAFTLVEALVSTAIATIAGTALLLGISSSIQMTDAVLDQTIAAGMAQQLMDEIAGCKYVEPGLAATYSVLGPDAGETSGSSREMYDDIDDFHGLNASPPCDYWGVPLGEENGSGGRRHVNFRTGSDYFAGWRQQVEVFFADVANPSSPLPTGQVGSMKIVRVQILAQNSGEGPRILAESTRVFSYVPQ
jgi:MSHA pilin protein MshD